jgi:hypothetical protein
MVTSESNQKGPPGNSTPCRCASPSVSGTTAVTPTAPVSPSSYRVIPGYDIPGKDIPSSNGQPFTRLCTTGSSGYKGKYGNEAYALMCRDTRGCVAVTTERSSSGCAYMKSAGAQSDIKPNSQWVTYTSRLPAAQPCKFVSIGERCTTSDPFWTGEQLCCGGNNPCVNGVCQPMSTSG